MSTPLPVHPSHRAPHSHFHPDYTSQLPIPNIENPSPRKKKRKSEFHSPGLPQVIPSPDPHRHRTSLAHHTSKLHTSHSGSTSLRAILPISTRVRVRGAPHSQKSTTPTSPRVLFDPIKMYFVGSEGASNQKTILHSSKVMQGVHSIRKRLLNSQRCQSLESHSRSC